MRISVRSMAVTRVMHACCPPWSLPASTLRSPPTPPGPQPLPRLPSPLLPPAIPLQSPNSPLTKSKLRSIFRLFLLRCKLRRISFACPPDPRTAAPPLPPHSPQTPAPCPPHRGPTPPPNAPLSSRTCSRCLTTSAGVMQLSFTTVANEAATAVATGLCSFLTLPSCFRQYS